MQELQQAVNAAFANIIAAGVIEKAIDAQLTKTVTSIVDEELRSYSDFGKQLKEHVKQALQVNFDGLGLPGYNDLILKVIRRQVEACTNDAIAKRVEEQMSELLQPAPAEITLTELVKSFIESNAERYSCSCDGPSEITLLVEESTYGSRWIYLDKESGKGKYDCGISFLVSDRDQSINALRIDRHDVTKTLFVGVYGFERKLFQLHAAGSKLIIDADQYDIDTHYPGHAD